MLTINDNHYCALSIIIIVIGMVIISVLIIYYYDYISVENKHTQKQSSYTTKQAKTYIYADLHTCVCVYLILCAILHRGMLILFTKNNLEESTL